MQQTIGSMSAQQFVEHRLECSHRPIEERLHRAVGLARKVAGVHGAKEPELAELAETVEEIAPLIVRQLERERTELLPALISGHRAPGLAEALARTAENDEELARLFAVLRQLAHGYSVPDWACRSYRALFESLAELEKAHANGRDERDTLRARLAA